MKKALPLPRTPRLEGDPVAGAIRDTLNDQRRTLFIMKPDKTRGKRAATAANRNRNNARYAQQFLQRLDDATK